MPLSILLLNTLNLQYFLNVQDQFQIHIQQAKL
jgi:hypothetical protein